MPAATPLDSFLGGIGLSLPVHALLLLNGKIFGVSGFIQRAVRGDKEALVAVAGLVIGGMTVGFVDGSIPEAMPIGLGATFLSGLLVGLGAKLANGCTSGHMFAGISRLSARSITAGATFLATGILTAYTVHGTTIPRLDTMDWSLKPHGSALLAAQAICLGISATLYAAAPKTTAISPPRSISRLLATLSTTINFALALSLSNLTSPLKVISFLLPFSRAFDPSFAFLALGGLPSAMFLYRYAGGYSSTDGKPRKPFLGGSWGVPNARNIDGKLIVGGALFGIGWGISGTCPGPALINLGRGLAVGSSVTGACVWLTGAILASVGASMANF